ncbi:MAG: CidA/LrgA family protein [Tissierellia bacterium]|nr:CidA/LrgA family protein [Tissierellia bacterium]
MKNLKGLIIIFLCLYGGKILSGIIPIMMPETIYGMVIMLILLLTKTIKLESIEEMANILISMMLIMFIPSGVNMIKIYDLIKADMIKLLITVSLSTIITIAATAFVIEKMIKLMEGEKIETDSIR